MKSTHTHRGTCQVCGAIQAIDNGKNRLALHGYTVAYGFFSGICRGSREQPMESSKALALATIDWLQDSVIPSHQSRISDLLAMRIDPDWYKVVQVENPAYDSGRNWRASKMIDKQVPAKLEELSDRDRAEQRNEAVDASAAIIHQAEHHTGFLRDLIARRHGQPVYPISDFSPKPAPVSATVSKQGQIEGERVFHTKQAQKDALERINRLVSAQGKLIQNVYLSIDYDTRREADRAAGGIDVKSEAYYAAPSYAHEWTAKKRALTLKAFPELTEVVAELDRLAQLAKEVKAIPVVKK